MTSCTFASTVSQSKLSRHQLLCDPVDRCWCKVGSAYIYSVQAQSWWFRLEEPQGDICKVLQCLFIPQGHYANSEFHCDILKCLRDDFWCKAPEQCIESDFFSHTNAIGAEHLPHSPNLITSDLTLFPYINPSWRASVLTAHITDRHSHGGIMGLPGSNLKVTAVLKVVIIK